MAQLQQLNVVALTTDLPDHGLVRGQVGTIVMVLAPGAYEVEFSDEEGRSYAELAVGEDQLMLLRYRPERAA